MTKNYTKKWCDMHCEHAEFPKKSALDGSKSCMTFSAIYCKLLDKHVAKNAPCAAPQSAGLQSKI